MIGGGGGGGGGWWWWWVVVVVGGGGGGGGGGGEICEVCGAGLLGVEVCMVATDLSTFIFGVVCRVTGAGVVGCGGGKGEVTRGGGG